MRRRRRSSKSQQAESEEMFSLEQAAAALGVSRSTLYRWQNQGRVQGFKVGRQWRFKRSDLENFSKMTHPSAASVNVGDISEALSRIPAGADAVDDVSLDRVLPGYPATEEEKAIERLFRGILASAAKDAATDVHIDAARDGTTVRERLDGVLHETVRLPRSAHGGFVSCVKAYAGIPLDQRSLPQDGRLAAKITDAEYDVRVATIPAVYGESVAMRLLPQADTLIRLDGPHGMSDRDLAAYRRALHEPCGMLIVAGPTGSGKTSILYAGMLEAIGPEKKTMTIEDPVEYALPHVTQTAVNRKAGYTYEAALRSFMRHDPDVVMCGNMRTLESAEICAQIALTGHLMLTQMHASSAAEVIACLLDMGLEPSLLSQSLIYVSAQRLVRRICSECGQPDEPDFNLLSPLAEQARVGGYQLPDMPKFMCGAGCDNCRGTGYRGRTGIYEVLEVNREIQRLIARRAPKEEMEEAAVRNGMTTLAADGLRKAAEGITSVAEAARVVPSNGD